MARRPHRLLAAFLIRGVGGMVVACAVIALVLARAGYTRGDGQ